MHLNIRRQYLWDKNSGEIWMIQSQILGDGVGRYDIVVQEDIDFK